MVGRAIRVEPAPPEEDSYTDGHAIYVAVGREPQAELAALVVQSALLAAGSLDVTVMQQLIGRRSVARRYLAVEGWRALATVGDCLPGVPVVTKSRQIELMSSSPEESLTVARGRATVPELPETFGMIRPRRVLAAGPVKEGGETTRQDLARQKPPENELREFDEDEETESIGKILKLFSSAAQIPLMAKLLKMLGAGRQQASGVGGAEVPIGGSHRTSRPGSKTEVSMLPALVLPTEVVSDRGWGWRYPEWDAYRSRYRKQWCTVMEVDPRPEDMRLVDSPPSGDLRRRLARLGVALERRRRQPQGDDIDVDAAVEARVEFLAGSTPEDGVYIESQRRRRSLAVLVLLDISGSVAERSSPLGSAHEQQRRAAAILLDALYWLGDRVALYGFRSQGRSSVYLIRVKSFDEVLTGLTHERLGGMVPGGFTRLGAAIRHSAHVLATQAGTERRLLVVLSDGFPYDDGYEGGYAEADARHALAETRRQGIGCLCLTLGATTPTQALRRVFGTAAHASAPQLEDLFNQIGPLFRQAMTSADLQRRLAQRHRFDNRSRTTTGKGAT